MATYPVRRFRENFSKIKEVVKVPNLVEIQQRSFEQFLQKDIPADQREDVGLQGVFKSVFPIKGFNQSASLEFVSYDLDAPRYDEEECRNRGMTYAAPIRVLVRLVVWDVDEATGAQSIRDVKEQEVYFGEVPLMTDFGTFIINGTERVIVSQLHRSPGVFFEHDKGKTHASGKLLFAARIIPYRGAWLDFEFDSKDLIHVRIDRRRKMLATVLLRALGYSVEDLLNTFYKSETFYIGGKNKIEKSVEPSVLIYQRATKDVKDSSGEVLLKKGKRFNRKSVEKLAATKGLRIAVDSSEMIDRIAAHDIVDQSTGEVILAVNEVLTEEKLEEIYKSKIPEISLLFIDDLNVGPYIRNTILSDKVSTPEEARLEIYRRLRPGDPSTPEAAQSLFENLFSNPERYDLSKVGRLKLNYKFRFDVPLEISTLRNEDILATVKYLVGLKDGEGEIDDIDHLGNRRVRSVGELLENQYRVGLVRMERAIRERMSLQDVETLMPNDLINPKPVAAVIKEFFGSSQLSQFMDQTNPLSEITHKRRLSALGPGGLTRERAGFEVRDVHPTHYGRICPVETPEGPNIGLISSLSIYSRVNDYGFIETPYRLIEGSKVTDNVKYCSALEEADISIAQANAMLDAKGHFKHPLVQARHRGEYVLADRNDVKLMDVSPQQLVSVAAALIPFLEHDDANRALMGANMQRQAVPLLRTESPLIGTGVEALVAADSGVTVVAKRDGIVTEVDANRIVVRADKADRKKFSSDVDIYNLTKFRRSNQSTCINQKPIVDIGDKVKKGDVIADGGATDEGELALGRNVVVAFMPWGGYNFEDSILISERVLKEDSYTSIHIEEFECAARDTKLGKEDVTRDIPNVGDEALKDLDESGIIRIGAEVKPGDILVGKVTPKGETQLSPEERLLRAIFGDKAGDVKDTSLRVPPGVGGVIIGAQVFSREGVELDDRAKEIQDEEKIKIRKDLDVELKGIRDTAAKRIKQLLVGKVSRSKVMDEEEERVLLQKGKTITDDTLNKIPFNKWSEISVEGGEEIESELADIFENVEDQEDLVRMMYDQKVSRVTKGDELPPGVIKIVKIFVAIKRKLAVGDKMAGRHGNKGVISRILPEEDMPYLQDGTPVDIILNPLGVPSRMNVGQVFEAHLGWAAKQLGEALQPYIDRARDDAIAEIKKIYNSSAMEEFLSKASEKQIREMLLKLKRGVPFASPVFDGASEDEVKGMLKKAGLPLSGQTTLFDGRTGEAFDSPVTVGVMYMLKLHHLVDEKLHARSIGPYSLVTQQPLGGKAQFGGQRLGEMEVWALEAYGAAYALQEFLTVKSDDVIGRTRMYEAIVKGEKILEPGLPESFKVLIKELQALCLDVELIEHE
ncbi:MAG TPA: DNA-directed RNA polymerase subunit beta [bacterium]|nr:DNA-directed RNA polymerase subunit beta [Myxococcales bacterium]OQA60816.1 MAG: DNA-directed RNA polymerase subunit beta [bacterium ADurb.Bin270]HPW45387.1 DNA-directed RNA polymerase subunit beta [bacterium]HQC50630.1 DNA-directed RNA polymerase subunit beta [bacterium]